MAAPDELQKGLIRKNGELAVNGLLKLSPELRPPHLPAVRALLRDEVLDAHRRGDWGRLGYWAARVEKEPRLCGEDGSEQAHALRWALTWGCGRCRDFARARRLWEPVRAPLEQRAPQLAAAMDEWLAERRGGPAIAALKLPTPAPRDPRLGYEPQRAKAALPAPPATLEAIEPAVLGCLALAPWPLFADTVCAWADAAPPELAAALRVLAGQLAVRQLLLGFEAGGLLLVRVIKEGHAPPELSGEALTAFRLVSSGLSPDPLEREEQARAYCELAGAAASYPQHWRLVADSLAQRLFTPAASRPALRLLEQLTAKALEPALATKGLRLWALAHPDAERAPEWIERAWRRLVEPGASLDRFVHTLDRKEQTSLLSLVSETLPATLAEPLIDRLWDGAGPELRTELASFLRMTIESLGLSSLHREAARLLDSKLGFEATLDLLLEQGALRPLSPAGLELLRRQGSRAIPLDLGLLRLALRHARSDEEARETARLFLADTPSIVSHLEAVAAADAAERFGLCHQLEQALLTRFAEDAAALAEGLVAARRMGAPSRLLILLAERFLAEQARRPAPDSRAVRDALVLSAKALGRKGKGKRKGKARRQGQAKAQAQRKAQGKAQGKAQPQGRAQPQGQAQVNANAQRRAQPERKVPLQAQAQANAQAKASAKGEANPPGTGEPNPEERPKPRSENEELPF